MAVKLQSSQTLKFLYSFLYVIKNFYALLPPIRAAGIAECVRKYVDRTSQYLQSFSPY